MPRAHSETRCSCTGRYLGKAPPFYHRCFSSSLGHHGGLQPYIVPTGVCRAFSLYPKLPKGLPNKFPPLRPECRPPTRPSPAPQPRAFFGQAISASLSASPTSSATPSWVNTPHLLPFLLPSLRDTLLTLTHPRSLGSDVSLTFLPSTCRSGSTAHHITRKLPAIPLRT